MEKQNLIDKIKQLESLSNDEKAYLVNLVNTKKKYGLVWEDKPEDVEEQLRTHLPVLREVVERRIEASPNPSKGGEKGNTAKTNENLQQSLFESENLEQSDSFSFPLGGGREGAPNHILIEGDNLHALTALTFTHEGRIDVMYFDPPYNTGSTDWKYNNDYVNKEDTFKHSKWLSFMNKRLIIAKKLLTTEGILICTIDENEHAELGMLLKEIFAEKEIVCVTIIHNPGGIQGKNFSYCHEYAYFVFPKYGIHINLEDRVDNPDVRPLRNVSKGAHLREHAANCFYPIFVKDKEIIGFGEVCDDSFHPDNVNILREDGILEIYPIDPSGVERKWVFARQSVEKIKDELSVEWNKQRKIYDVIRGKTKFNYKTVWTDKKYNANLFGSQLINDIIDTKFPFPKSLYAVKECIKASVHPKNALVLDIFAGSGTTLHATMQLNAEDGGNRQCILVTNNENNICEEVTYERNRRVIQGYTNSKGEWVPGLTNNNMRYYKSEFVESAKTEENRRKLTMLSTELLQIKENCYHSVKLPETVKPQHAQAFTNEKGKYMLVVYYHRTQNETSAILTQWIKGLAGVEGKIKLYGFSPETEVLVNDFFEVASLIDPVPLPDAIYNAYRNTFRTLKINKRAQIRKNQATINATGENENAKSEETVQTDLF